MFWVNRPFNLLIYSILAALTWSVCCECMWHFNTTATKSLRDILWSVGCRGYISKYMRIRQLMWTGAQTYRLVFVDWVLDAPRVLGHPGGVEYGDTGHAQYGGRQSEVDAGWRDLKEKTNIQQNRSKLLNFQQTFGGTKWKQNFPTLFCTLKICWAPSSMRGHTW